MDQQEDNNKHLCECFELAGHHVAAKTVLVSTNRRNPVTANSRQIITATTQAGAHFHFNQHDKC